MILLMLQFKKFLNQLVLSMKLLKKIFQQCFKIIFTQDTTLFRVFKHVFEPLQLIGDADNLLVRALKVLQFLGDILDDSLIFNFLQ